jgi:hypothetical protein
MRRVLAGGSGPVRLNQTIPNMFRTDLVFGFVDAVIEFVPDFGREIGDEAVSVNHIGLFCVSGNGPCRNGFACRAQNFANFPGLMAFGDQFGR